MDKASEKLNFVKNVKQKAITSWLICFCAFNIFPKKSLLFCVLPTLSAIATYYTYILMDRKLQYELSDNGKSNMVSLVSYFGTINYGIYLFHPFVAYEFTPVAKKILTAIYPLSDMALWTILLPAVLVLSIVVAIVFSKIEKIIKILI